MSNQSEAAPSLDSALTQHLARLLEAHGVRSTLRASDVLVDGNEATWARLVTSPSSKPNVLRIDVEVAAPDGSVLRDSLNGLGHELDTRIDDVLTQFCIADFHVFLASVWGLLEEDQVDHHLVVTDTGNWDLYLGPWLSRMSDPAETIQAPERAFSDALLGAAARILVQRKPSAGRVFIASLKGEMTYEALLDGTPNDELESLLRALPLEHAVTGYASQRLFFVAVPHDGVTAHRRVSRCSGSTSRPARPASRHGVLLAVALLAVALAAAAYLLR